MAGGKDVTESDVVSATGVVGEIDRDMFTACGSVVDVSDRYEGAGIAEVGQYPHLQLIFTLGLLEIKG